MLGGYGRCRTVLVKKSSRNRSYLLGSLHQRIQKEKTTSGHLDVSVTFVTSLRIFAFVFDDGEDDRDGE